MRLQVSRSKNAASLYVIKTVYVDGKEKTLRVEKLGTEAELRERLNGEDPYVWAKAHIDKLNREEEDEERTVLIPYEQSKVIPKGEKRSFNGGYLFLQKIYHGLMLNKICKDISSRHKYDYDLDSILSRLIYGRVVYPSSKLSTYELSKNFIEQPNFDLHQIYRALDILSEESDFIQSSLYKNSLRLSSRNTGILYYDCTNYFFEIEQEEGLKMYGYSKEHKPNPIVQMGLFMDGDGIPLAFSINKGNTNEQSTLTPLEKKILKDYNLSKFVVCTDAGLASEANRKFNDKDDRAFITTQSIKKLKKHLKDWATASDNWKTLGSESVHDISKMDEMLLHAVSEEKKKLTEQVFYKERWIIENGFEQRLIVSFSLKYRNYLRNIRDQQIERAKKTMEKNPTKLKKFNQNDYRRFINRTNITPDGEIAKIETYRINEDLVSKEEVFDGLYGVCTNLTDSIESIIKVNQRRWEIEECFRIMKSELKSRPVYLKNDSRIEGHFLTCFLALVVYRYLEKKLGEKFTCCEIINGLRGMNFLEGKGEGYIPSYTRNDFTDALHDAFGFRTDYEIVSNKKIKKIFKDTKC